MTGWRPRSHFFLHRIINLPNSTAVSQMPCPWSLVFLGTSLGSPSGMSSVKTRRKGRWHFGNLQEREGDKEARPKQQWIWTEEERVWMSTQSLCHLRASNIHIPLPPQMRSQIRSWGVSEAHSVWELLKIKGFKFEKKELLRGFRVDIGLDTSSSASPYGVRASFKKIPLTNYL